MTTGGKRSALETATGAAVGVLIGWASQFTKYPMDAAQIGAVAVVASLLSSYILGNARKPKN